jgi:hypothetical protein
MVFARKGAALLVAFTLASALAALLLPAVPQPAEYHDFADRRTILGIANFFDVASNLAFLATGFAGLLVIRLRRERFEQRAESLPYAVFFLGVALTAVGSGYYHLAPDNARLFWDRLPMTIAFMSLIAAQIVDRLSVRAGLVLLGPMLAVGMASVVYWIFTERAHEGNVVPYVVLQAYSAAALLLIALTRSSRYTRGGDIYWVLAGYVAAKVLEFLDREVLAFGQIVSGHSLKHVAAGIAGLVVCRMLWLRTPMPASPRRSH